MCSTLSHPCHHSNPIHHSHPRNPSHPIHTSHPCHPSNPIPHGTQCSLLIDDGSWPQFQVLSKFFCVFLCIYVAFERHRISYSWENTLSDNRETFFISQNNCRTEIAGASFRQSQPTHRYEFDRLQKGVMLCKLFQHTCFALTLIALAGDIESNPGYLTFDGIKTTRGLKITHLKIRLFASRGS